MNNVLGIDLGTSSVKVLQRFSDGSFRIAKRHYASICPQGWWQAVKAALLELDLSETTDIGLSSQVGTYIVDGTTVISWNDGVAEEELAEICARYSRETFLKEISMPHPQILSYPMPRLSYIKKMYPEAKTVCQPKDFLCQKLTGNLVTDPYSWRGLANLEKKCYSATFLEDLGYTQDQLPEMRNFDDLAGVVLGPLAEELGLPSNTRVYVGLNDYFASLLAMGIRNVGDLFDITGTSEHLGVLEGTIAENTRMVTGPYLYHNVHYGVTASSGMSLELGRALAESVNPATCLARNAPIFLPYVKGERAPIWDSSAKGVYFGIGPGCDRQDLSYAVLEGVVFSLYHIYESMGSPAAQSMTVSGGAANNDTLNYLKAEMFGLPVRIPSQKETSALGACMTIPGQIDIGQTYTTLYPDGKLREKLLKRFEIYKELYPQLKGQFHKWEMLL